MPTEACVEPSRPILDEYIDYKPAQQLSVDTAFHGKKGYVFVNQAKAPPKADRSKHHTKKTEIPASR